MKTGMIGLGAMGTGMARNVAGAGFLYGVYNRNPVKAHDLARELNVLAYEQPDELASAVDIVLMCVSADRDVLDLVSSIARAMKPGSIVVDMSTVSGETARQAASILSANHVEFLDAPVGRC